MTIINLDPIDLDRHVRTLYNHSHRGAISFPRILDPSFQEKILREILAQEELFVRRPTRYLNAEQDIESFYLGEADEEMALQGHFPAVLMLRDAYATLTSAIARRDSFQTNGFPNSIAVQRYRKGSLGITPHRDESQYINLIASFTLCGEADVYTCHDRDKQGSERLDSSPGSLILLRAPRRVEEEGLRPIHYIGKAASDRYVVLFRERKS